MSENVRVSPLVRPAAELLLANNHVVPESLRTASPDTVAAASDALNEPTEALYPVTNANAATHEYTVISPRGTDALNEVTVETLAYDGKQPTDTPSTLSKIADKINPVAIARNMAAKRAALTPAEKAESLRKAGKIVAVVGSIAAVGAGVYMIAKGAGMHFGHESAAAHPSVGTWHDSNSPAHINTSPDTSHVTTGPSNPPQPHTSPSESFRTASPHENSGSASNVTTWSRESLQKEAIDAGLTKSQASSLSHDQHNINMLNNAFYHDNKAVGHDTHHYLYAHTKYETTGQNTAADHIIDTFKAQHHIPTGTTPQHVAPHITPPAHTEAVPQPAQSTHTTAPLPVGTRHAVPAPSSSETGPSVSLHTSEPRSGMSEKAFDALGLGAGAITVGTIAFAVRAIAAGRKSSKENERKEFASHYGVSADFETVDHRRGGLRERQARARQEHEDQVQAAIAAATIAVAEVSRKPADTDDNDSDRNGVRSHRAPKGYAKRAPGKSSPAPGGQDVKSAPVEADKNKMPKTTEKAIRKLTKSSR